MSFRIINSGFNTGSMNMAIDEALLDSKNPVLRFYQWKPACVSIGYGQDVNDINLKECKRLGIDIVRRITGGKAVIHDNELTYSFICDEKLLPKGVVDSYKVISKGILNALSSMGVDATMKKDFIDKSNSSVCFMEPSWYELVVNGRKIVGSAQKRVNGKVLQHGSMLIDFNLDKQVAVFGDHVRDKLQNRITWLNNEINVNYNDVLRAMTQGFSDNFKIKFEDSILSENEIKKSKLLEKKYLFDDFSGNNST